MIPQPSPRISTVIAASYRPEPRPSRKTSPAVIMGEPATALPTRTRSKRTTRSSQSSQSTTSSQEHQQQQQQQKQQKQQKQNQDQQLYDQHHQHHYYNQPNPKLPADRTLSNPSPAAVARAARPNLAARTSSAPAIPQSREGVSRPGDDDDDEHDDEHDDEVDPDQVGVEEDEGDTDHPDNDGGLHDHHHDPSERRSQRPEYRPRDSVASIKDDPFFRHYQTPHSISLGRELMAATYEREEDEDAELVSPLSPPPHAAKKPSVDEGVNLPVSEVDAPSPFPLRERWGRFKNKTLT
jgi:hypothetical protein